MHISTILIINIITVVHNLRISVIKKKFPCHLGLSKGEVPPLLLWSLLVVDLLSVDVVLFFLRRLARGACWTSINVNPSLCALLKASYVTLSADSTKVLLCPFPRMPGVIRGVCGRHVLPLSHSWLTTSLTFKRWVGSTVRSPDNERRRQQFSKGCIGFFCITDRQKSDQEKMLPILSHKLWFDFRILWDNMSNRIIIEGIEPQTNETTLSFEAY